MGKQDKRHQAMQHSGETGKARSVSRFMSAKDADTVARTKRQQLPNGSSDWFTVEATRRKGRG